MIARLSRYVVSVVLIVMLALAVAPFAGAQEGSAPDYWPTEGWRTSTPEEQGMDSEVLAAFIESVPSLGDVDSLMIVRNGYVVAEVYWHPFQRGLKRELCSVTKSVISALVGIAIEQGYIESIDQKVLEFFPDLEVKNLDDNKRAMTIRDLLTMTSGFACEISAGTDPSDALIGDPDATESGLSWRMADRPGTTWRYCGINAYLLSAILTRTTGMDTLAFAEQFLFTPLGITSASWNVSAEGLALGDSGLLLSTQDMAKIGYLYLNNGRWGDAQIVPADWVRESLQNYAPRSPWGVHNVGYGYLWWLYHTEVGDFYEAAGAYFQHIRVFPEKNLVVADTGTDLRLHQSDVYQPFLMKTIMQTVKSDESLPPNPEAAARLEAAVYAAANPEAQPVETLPPLASQISGRTYRLTTPDLLLAEIDVMRLPEEDWQMATLGLDFAQDSATLRLQTVSGIDVTVPVGLDGVWRVSTSHLGTLAARGKWETETHFGLYLHRLEQGPVLRFSLNFSGDAVTGAVARTRPGEIPSGKPVSGQMMP